MLVGVVWCWFDHHQASREVVHLWTRKGSSDLFLMTLHNKFSSVLQTEPLWLFKQVSIAKKGTWRRWWGNCLILCFRWESTAVFLASQAGPSSLPVLAPLAPLPLCVRAECDSDGGGCRWLRHCPWRRSELRGCRLIKSWKPTSRVQCFVLRRASQHKRTRCILWSLLHTTRRGMTKQHTFPPALERCWLLAS